MGSCKTRRARLSFPGIGLSETTQRADARDGVHSDDDTPMDVDDLDPSPVPPVAAQPLRPQPPPLPTLPRSSQPLPPLGSNATTPNSRTRTRTAQPRRSASDLAQDLIDLETASIEADLLYAHRARSNLDGIYDTPSCRLPEDAKTEVEFRRLVMQHHLSNNAADDFTRFHNSRARPGAKMRMTRAIENSAANNHAIPGN
jgi:hypothetical protein